ncbi:thiol-disulfide oxidoreductase DCC family protein [Carboxylicivirga marina]|uniref:DUF393 domain-containing protein n=1 Tax=Carboxylicivirga marina TaxID=2800988 RepID=A0ABS1HLY6_9BACT|nr:DCC1-like thiol-disulfide oxidoreductase family protein [Carboxylicivirga marina]MBK3518179.1 DUF393 domain-containing protein [Carboxylicivirga marina]
MKAVKTTDLPIIYYDGQCGFCLGFVSFLRKHSRADRKVNFIPFQLVSRSIGDELLLIHHSKTQMAGEAAISLLYLTGGLWTIAAILAKLIPKKILNKLYYKFARNRYRWFGKTACNFN